MRKFYSYIHNTIAYLLSILVGLCYVLASLSPYINPEKLIYPALLSLFFCYILLGQLLLFAYWLIRRKKLIILFYICLFILSSPTLLSYFPISLTSQDIEEVNEQGHKTLKILSYNTQVFGFEGHSKDKPNNILKYIKESGADLVCLQEASYTIRVGSCINRDKLHNYLKDTYPYIREQVAQNDGSMFILLSKYPIKSCKRLAIKSRANGAAAYTVNIDGKEVMILDLHLESFKISRREDQYIQYVKNKNLKALKYIIKGRIAPVLIAHTKQAKIIENFIKRSKIKHVIVCGDFNDTPLSYAHHILSDGLEDAYINKGLGLGFSIRTSIFVGRIDHILYSNSFRALSSQVDNSINSSDHSPIMTTLSWAED